MKAFRIWTIIFLISLMAVPGWAQNKTLVIGQNLKAGMELKSAISLLGIPQAIHVDRGVDSLTASIFIKYPQHGVVIHAMNGGGKVEGIEILPSFKGKFASGVKLGDRFPALVNKYGMPTFISNDVARYPNLGLYFQLNNEVLLSAKSFLKGSKLFKQRLSNPVAD